MSKRTYNPCDDCQYSYSKNNQENEICKICELTYFKDRKQKEGEWQMKVYPITSCSVCGVLRSVEYQQGWNYCPNCGAKMKGGAE